MRNIERITYLNLQGRRVQLKCEGTRGRTGGGGREGETGEWSG